MASSRTWDSLEPNERSALATDFAIRPSKIEGLVKLTEDKIRLLNIMRGNPYFEDKEAVKALIGLEEAIRQLIQLPDHYLEHLRGAFFQSEEMRSHSMLYHLERIEFRLGQIEAWRPNPEGGAPSKAGPRFAVYKDLIRAFQDAVHDRPQFLNKNDGAEQFFKRLIPRLRIVGEDGLRIPRSTLAYHLDGLRENIAEANRQVNRRKSPQKPRRPPGSQT